MKKLIVCFLFTLPLICNSQFANNESRIVNLKKEFRDMSWLNDEKCAEIISTLSYLYGSDSLRSNKKFVTITDYNLYIDSLTLYNFTNDKRCKNEEIYHLTTGNTTKQQISEEHWQNVYNFNTYESYFENNKKTSIGICIPSNWDNLNLFYKEESNKIKSFNYGRIKRYTYQIPGNKDTLVGTLYFHRTIKPISSNAQSNIGKWYPVFYAYPKPKSFVYKSNINTIFESKTGLPHNLINELNLDSNRVVNILKKLPKPNTDLIDTTDIYKDIIVNNDTCIIKIFDNQKYDNDIIKYTSDDKSDTILITNNTVNKTVCTSNTVTIKALSTGDIGLCTVTAIIDKLIYVFQLRKDQSINLRFINNKQDYSCDQSFNDNNLNK